MRFHLIKYLSHKMTMILMLVLVTCSATLYLNQSLAGSANSGGGNAGGGNAGGGNASGGNAGGGSNDGGTVGSNSADPNDNNVLGADSSAAKAGNASPVAKKHANLESTDGTTANVIYFPEVGKSVAYEQWLKELTADWSEN